MMNKVVYIEAKFKPEGKIKTINVPTGEKKKGFFGSKEITKSQEQWEQTGWSDSEVDGERLSDDLNKAVKKLNNEGYEVISVTPIRTSGGI